MSLLSDIYLQIKMVKYDADKQIKITNKNLWIVWSHFFHWYANIHLHSV